MTRRIQPTIAILAAALFTTISAFAGETSTSETAPAAKDGAEQKLEVRKLEESKPAPRRILRFERMGMLEDRHS